MIGWSANARILSRGALAALALSLLPTSGGVAQPRVGAIQTGGRNTPAWLLEAQRTKSLADLEREFGTLSIEQQLDVVRWVTRGQKPPVALFQVWLANSVPGSGEAIMARLRLATEPDEIEIWIDTLRLLPADRNPVMGNVDHQLLLAEKCGLLKPTEARRYYWTAVLDIVLARDSRAVPASRDGGTR